MLNKLVINFEIPQGYVVESMPASINIATGNDIGAFKFMMVNTASRIQTAITSTIATAIVSPDFSPVLKDFYQQMMDKQNEKIVLKKI